MQLRENLCANLGLDRPQGAQDIGTGSQIYCPLGVCHKRGAISIVRDDDFRTSGTRSATAVVLNSSKKSDDGSLQIYEHTQLEDHELACSE